MMNKEMMIEMMKYVSQKMPEQEELLCRLDSQIGDGDHGVTVARGFKAVEKMLNEDCFETPGAVMQETGRRLSASMGGAIGPILGGFFEAGGIMEGESPDNKEFDRFFTEGVKAVCLVGGAEEGDRTMVDALAPAARAFHEESIKFDETDCMKALKACFEQAEQAAALGAERTKEMMARKGRARFLRDKSIGYVDAGAVTVSLIIHFMNEYLCAKARR